MRKKKMTNARNCQQVKNVFCIKVKKCCMSCAYKDFTRHISKRQCTALDKLVAHTHVCPKWAMSQQQRMAGFAKGKVKRKEYLMYVLSVREEESLAQQRGLKIKIKSIETIREEFEEQYGSIYAIE